MKLKSIINNTTGNNGYNPLLGMVLKQKFM